MNIFLACGIIFLFALVSSRLLGRLRFPAVTSYLLLGVLIGPYGLKLLPEILLESTDLVGYFVLGIIAFSLGENFLWKQFKQIGRAVVIISCFEAVGAMGLVTLGLLLINRPVSEAIVFGGIAAATAPMATVMVIRESRAKGSFTNALLNIVAIDDGWGIIAFAFAVAVAKLLISPSNIGNPVISATYHAFREIFGALILGFALASLSSILSRYVKAQADLLIYTLGFILATTGISIYLGFSPLLANMCLGAVVVNLTKSHRFFTVLRRIDWPFYLLFFVLVGSSLEIPLLKNLSLLGIVYVVGRILGKYTGTYLGGQIAHVESKMKKYLGLGLIPQAGVALGLAIVAKSELSQLGDLIFNTIVATTIVFEIIGPFCTKYALSKAGETGKS